MISHLGLSLQQVLECNGDFPERTDYNSPWPVCQTDVLGINLNCRKRQWWSPTQFLNLADLCGIDRELNPYDTSPVDDLLRPGHGRTWSPSVGFYCVQEGWKNRIHEEGMYQPPGAKRIVEAPSSAVTFELQLAFRGYCNDKCQCVDSNQQIQELTIAWGNTGVHNEQGEEEAAYGEIASQDGANQEVPAICNAAAHSVPGIGTSLDNVDSCSSEAAAPAAQPVIDLNPLTSTSHAAALQTLADWLSMDYPNLPPQEALAVAAGSSQALAGALATANEDPEQGIVEEAQGAHFILDQLTSAIQGQPESSSALETLADAANQLTQQLDAQVHRGQADDMALYNPAYTNQRILDGLQAIMGPGLPLAESLRTLHQVALHLSIWLNDNRPLSASRFQALLTACRMLEDALSRLAVTMGASSSALLAQAQIAHDLVRQLVQIGNSDGTNLSVQGQMMREIMNALETLSVNAAAEMPAASAEAVQAEQEAKSHQECGVRAPVIGRGRRTSRAARGCRGPRLPPRIVAPTGASLAKKPGRPRGRRPGRPRGSNQRAPELGVNINYGPVRGRGSGRGRGRRGARRSSGSLSQALSQQLRDWPDDE